MENRLYRQTVENQLQLNNVNRVWRSLRTMSGYKECSFQPVGDKKWSNELNHFFNRFDSSFAPVPGLP